jgi:hypothetical protein
VPDTQHALSEIAGMTLFIQQMACGLWIPGLTYVQARRAMLDPGASSGENDRRISGDIGQVERMRLCSRNLFERKGKKSCRTNSCFHAPNSKIVMFITVAIDFLVQPKGHAAQGVAAGNHHHPNKGRRRFVAPRRRPPPDRGVSDQILGVWKPVQGANGDPSNVDLKALRLLHLQFVWLLQSATANKEDAASILKELTEVSEELSNSDPTNVLKAYQAVLARVTLSVSYRDAGQPRQAIDVLALVPTFTEA